MIAEFLNLYGSYVYLALGLIVFFIIIINSVFITGGDYIRTLERRWIGKDMPPNRTIALNDEVGIQAGVLSPGIAFRWPFLYTSKKHFFYTVPNNKVGYVEALTGDPILPGRIFGKIVDCEMFQDGEAFLKNGGQKGPQIQILPPGQYKINPRLFYVQEGTEKVIKENEIGIIESIDGEAVPPGRIFGKVVESNLFQDANLFFLNGGQKGPQIQILPPGNYRIHPLLFKLTVVENVVINKGEVGTVVAMDGAPIDPGRLLGKKIPGHSNFEDGKTFLANGGQKGPQSEILLPGIYRINRALFKVEIRPATVIGAKKIGLVTAKDGEPLPETEYVAKPIEGIDNFQNVEAFLTKKGQRGPQYDILKPGTYYINPLMFDVAVEDVVNVERGQVAVIISNVGIEQKSESEKEAGIERYVVPKGYRGIQDEVVGPGAYYMNKWAFIYHIVDTTNITIDWDEENNTRFNPLEVVSHDAFEINVSVKVVLRIRPDQAPHMIAKIGSIDNLINHVVHPMIDSSFRNQASSTSAMAFLQNRHEEQKKAELHTRAELEKYHVELVSVLICQIELPPALMLTQTEKIIAEQQKAMYTEQQKAEGTRISTEKTRAEANMQGTLVQSEIGVKIADNDKQKMIHLAQGKGQSTQLEMEGEAKGIEAIGLAKAAAYEAQKTAVGAEGLISIEIADKIASGNIKITPDFLVQGGSDGIGNLLSATLLKNLSK